VKCTNIRTVNACEILWYDKTKYLGIDLIAARVFKCSYDNAKCKFYRALNAVLGKVERTAPEELIIQLLKTKISVFRYHNVSQESSHLSVPLSNLNRFSRFLHCWKAYDVCYKIRTTIPTSP